MNIFWTLTACCAAIASAVPLSNNRLPILSRSTHYKETDLLNFILSLEQFQDAFYRQGLANFTQAQFAQAGFDADFYSNLTELASQEHTHVTSLTSTLRQLNATPVAECEYNFNVTNPSIFVVPASLLEAVSVSSDIGLEVTFVTYGQNIKVNSDSEPLYAAFLTLSDPVFAPTTRLPNNGGFNTTVPAAPEGYAPINGPTYVVLSSCNTTLTDDTIVAGPATIEIHLK
ncbi:MAG: hypothetical protein OHK93_002036 [Ramalina farinacea]|uniref:Uncharacterized protein n=1 Tax=Ramalina farinacea TaxID=258253 RepID=A0AA43TTE1_9LECA|nr:hypothetical protein [Ramalina farinacea]